MGRDAFEAELRLYYDMDLTPEEVAERALAEIRETRGLMAETAAEHWRETRRGESAPDGETALIAWALASMEENRPSTQQESLEVFTRFAYEAEAFVRARLAGYKVPRSVDFSDELPPPFNASRRTGRWKSCSPRPAPARPSESALWMPLPPSTL